MSTLRIHMKRLLEKPLLNLACVATFAHHWLAKLVEMVEASKMSTRGSKGMS